MANYNNVITKNFIDAVFPKFGSKNFNLDNKLPIWDNSQRMFITNEYVSQAGHRYYCGIRFNDRIAVVEKIGLYHNWTYIDGIDLYIFEGKEPRLVQQRKYDKVYHNEGFVRSEVMTMVSDYIASTLKIQRVMMSADQIKQEAQAMVESTYKSLLDSDYNTSMLRPILDCMEQQEKQGRGITLR